MISPLLTDLYQLTMAYGYWKLGLHEREAVFQLIYRRNPFRGNYAIACGLDSVIEFLGDWHFKEDDLVYLSQLRSVKEDPLFSLEFLDYLSKLRFSGNLDAIPEGTVVFAQEPLLRVTAPLIQGQLLESTLLNLMNFQTLIATKAMRIYRAAAGDEVLEFGLRRAQGPDGALSASRAAYIGGCAATSNVLAGKKYGIPVKGTHAHSWVTVFPDELSAFTAYAEIMPNNCVLLVDTYNTIRGIQNAIKVGHLLRQKGSELLAIRLDSGDMTALSIQARTMLDEAGFTHTKIIASNSLNEDIILEMKQKGAKISIWGVGTQLVTSYDYPALDGVYKLSALQNHAGVWEYKLKLSEQVVKISNPGIYQVRRFLRGNHPVMDVMYDTELGISTSPEMIALDASPMKMPVEGFDSMLDLLKPIYVRGELIYQSPTIHLMREYAIQQAAQFLEAYPEKNYPVGLEKKLHNTKLQLINNVSSQV